jgi:hypothetical protein
MKSALRSIFDPFLSFHAKLDITLLRRENLGRFEKKGRKEEAFSISIARWWRTLHIVGLN